MSLLVVGSVAYDALETPFGKRDRILGGAATHFSLSASFFTKVSIVGVVGDDFAAEDEAVLAAHNVDTSDIERVAGGKTFFWRGRYDYDMNTAHTLETQLNVFEHFQPKLSAKSKEARIVFLANIVPDLQLQVCKQVGNAVLVGLDTMNLWIDIARESLQKTIEAVDLLIINDAEARGN